MDDLIFELLDLAAELLGWLLPLIGKYWFLILGYIGYKVFGKAAKKAEQKQKTLTPAESGGFPTPPKTTERKAVRASSKHEPVYDYSLEDADVERERPYRYTEADEREVHERLKRGSTSQEVPNSKPAINLDPREGMKWALIFGEPRSKAPYSSPNTRRRSE
jgi:hypothetical protein